MNQLHVKVLKAIFYHYSSLLEKFFPTKGVLMRCVGIICMLGRDAHMNSYQQNNIYFYHLLLVFEWFIRAAMFMRDKSSEPMDPSPF
jgi:hypothetical protein